MTGPAEQLQALVRDLEQDPRGLSAYAARLSNAVAALDPYLLPQIAVSDPVPEPTYPELLEYNFDAPAEGET